MTAARRLTAVLLLLAALVPASAARGQNPASMRESLEAQRQRAEQGREALTRLTEQERELHGDLARAEDELDRLKADLHKQERALAALQAERDAAGREHARLSAHLEDSRAELARLMRALWPLRVADMRGRTAGSARWDRADRNLSWGAALYADARRAMEEVRTRSRKLAESVERAEALSRQAAERLAAVDAKKDESLAKRLEFVRDIRRVRAERINEEQALAQVMAVIKDLDYRIKASTGRRFSAVKGSLPAPVSGKALPKSATNGANTRKGLGFATADGASVTAVHWGKVVYNDVLRGFGQVVILYHGDDYYTLYAFLGSTNVNAGQEVEKGEPLGTAGYFPPAKGSGVYFELRLGQKAINPQQWLAGRG
ncbi:murein hydrolase activator EnvC family protein [Desulfocurvus sp. DL9XJH121]